MMRLGSHQVVTSPGVVAAFLLLQLVSSLAGACVDEERAALLSFLDGISPRAGDGIAASWRGSQDCCAWEGVSCDGGGGGAVTRVSLPGRGLGGTISPSLANLTALTYLNLSGNSLAGTFPADLLSLPNAAVLDVSYNRLSGVLPDLPTSTGRAPLPLQVLDISSNELSGQFPSVVWHLTPNLVSLNASNNSFGGAIPVSLCAICPALTVLDVSVNAFGGAISPGLGNCSQLRVLSAGRNNLTGELPDDLFDVAALQQLLLPSNRIQGRLDRLNIAKLANLVKLDLSYNGLTGRLPESIGALTKLEELRLNKNNLTGTIPQTLSNATGLRCVELRSNSFVGDLSAFDFSGLVNLTVFDVAANNFTGTMPSSIYSCTSMTALRVSNNEIAGQVAPEIGNMQRLQFLSLTVNSFTNISGLFWNLQGCKDLAALLISYNFYGEALPDASWVGDHVSNLQVIVMEGCGQTGQIPAWISKLHGLYVLSLAGNRLTGPIPTWLGAMKNLYYVDLSNNLFSSEIPPSLMELQLLTSEKAMSEFNPGHLPVVFTLTPNNGANVRQGRAYYQMSGVAATLNLSYNNLSGAIPEEVGQMKTLQVLNLGHNNLSGGISPELGGLTRLENLELRRNRFTGSIPPELNKLHFLARFNVSYNDLEGPIPTGGQFDAFPASSFAGNPKLCGPAISVQCGQNAAMATGSSKTVGKRVLLAIVLGVCFGLVAVVVVLGFAVIAIRRIMSNGSVSDGGKCAEASLFHSTSELDGDENDDTILFMSEECGDAARKTVTFLDILKATDNFSPSRIIGTGGYGLVFLAEMEGGARLAVKKLNGDMCLVEREFRAEVEALSVTRHENLVPLQGFCIRGRLRLLLYPYMANGSLHDWLHDRPEQELDWPARLRIARGASRGVQHIHERCTPQIVHRDIKSSNILLDESGEARVADFGLARLILPDQTHVSTELVGTLGYIPPEYGQGWVATLRGDVYSLGVVLLELLTGRLPVELVTRHGQRWDLVGWVMQMRSAGKHAETLDPRLRRGPGEEAQMLYMLDLACLCVDAIPLSRPAIQEVVSWLDNVDTIGTSS